MELHAEVIEFPTLLAKKEKEKTEDKEEKVEDKESSNESDGETDEEKEPKEKMLKLSITGHIKNNVFFDHFNALGPFIDKDERHRVLLTISSHGGGCDASLAAIDVLKAWPEPNVVVAGGINASGATLFIAQGDLRLAVPSARFMIHDSFSINDGSIEQQEERLRSHKYTTKLYHQLYQDHIGLTKKELDRILQKDTWFNAHEALNLGTKGLIDGIILKLLDGFKYEILMRNGVRKVVDLHNDDFNEVRNLTIDAVKDQKVIEIS